MIKLQDIYDFLDRRFPFDTSLDFDNTGILIGDKNAQVKKAVIALDCNKEVLKKAEALSADLIITHHPVIFNSIKSVTAQSVVFGCVKSGIGVISCHTNLDIADGGVSDELCKKIGLKNIKPFTAFDGFTLREGETDSLSPKSFAKLLSQKLDTSVRYVPGKADLKRILVCSGSGGDYLSEAIKENFDALLTADVKHNVFIDAQNAEISLFDAGHYATENVILEPLKNLLGENFKDVEFILINNENILHI